jgi:hypothetical protein
MQSPTNPSELSAGRRTFLKSAGTVAAGLYLAGGQSPARAETPAAAKSEKLALMGGPKAVTAPAGNATRWPLYGPDEEKAVLALVRSPDYAPLTLLENEWKKYYQVPYAKPYCNGTSALTTMFFALNLPPGSEIMVPGPRKRGSSCWKIPATPTVRRSKAG